MFHASRITHHVSHKEPMSLPYVIIGGDAAGMSAASKIKREQPDAHVIVYERSQHISYSACGMPYWIGGVIKDGDDLLAVTLEDARNKRKLAVHVRHEVVAIDPQRRVVEVRRLEIGDSFEQPYEKLIIATGASPTWPAIPGVDLPGVFALRSLEDGQRIYEYIAQAKPKRATLIGAGFIALEMAENLVERGVEVELLVRSNRILSEYDTDMTSEIAEHIQQKDVKIHWQTQVQEIRRLETEDWKLEIDINAISNLKSQISTDFILFATGIKPNSDLARTAGLRLGVADAIWVDGQMHTSDPHILAAGDCVQFTHLVTGDPVWIPLATSSNKSGRIAGENAIGGTTVFPGVAGTSVLKVFDYTAAITGLSEKQAKVSSHFGTKGEHVGTVIITHDDKAGYMPGAEPIRTKLIFDKRDGRLLGGQLVGKAGVNKRIDILATALSARMTLAQISLLDLSYAPPYSPVYDAILIAANVGMKDVRG